MARLYPVGTVSDSSYNVSSLPNESSPGAPRLYMPGNAKWPGFALAAVVAASGLWLAQQPALRSFGLSALTFAIIIGMVLGNTVFPHIAPHTAAGVDFCKNRLLRAGIVLFGFNITFQQAATVGIAGVILDAVIILSVFGLAMTLGRRVFRLDRQTCMLVGAGSAICGAAAVMAMEPVARAQAHKVSVAVATVVVFGTLSMFLYPLLFPYMGMSEHAFGIYIGSTVHEVAQVVAAGDAVGPIAAGTAIVEKMLRVMMLAPFLMGVSWWMQRRERRSQGSETASRAKPTIPWFAVGFVVAVGINSLGVLGPSITTMLVQTSTIFLAMAMAALGLRTHAGAIRQAGAAPLALAGMLFLFLIVGGYGLNLLAQALS